MLQVPQTYGHFNETNRLRKLQNKCDKSLVAIDPDSPTTSKSSSNISEIFLVEGDERVHILSGFKFYTVSHRVSPFVTFVMQLCKLRDDFDDDGQLDSIAPSAPARHRQNYLEVAK